MPLNTQWNITFGTYAFTVDRQTLTYRLQETQTGAAWADALSLGWIEIEERETGSVTRHDFGALKLISLSEKAGAQGKRILFGLDAPGGIPVDVYLTCSEREIQLTVEANRDTRTHRVGEIGLLPGLCAARDTTAYLVFPQGEGVVLHPREAPTEPISLPIWEAATGLTMPFIGAVQEVTMLAPRPGGRVTAALALLTDSAYARAELHRAGDAIFLDLCYARDPERRRLDIRIVPIPNGDPVDIAMAYRDKCIGEGNHATLRRKIRERPELMTALETGFPLPESSPLAAMVWSEPGFALSLDAPGTQENRWDILQGQIDSAQEKKGQSPTLLTGFAGGDWSANVVDVWYERRRVPLLGTPVPLRAVVYHDAVATVEYLEQGKPITFLRALLRLAPPAAGSGDDTARALLQRLYLLSFSAFLTRHRFLGPDYVVEEAYYSNGAHIVINPSGTKGYETADLHLPPFGFLVTHPQIMACYAYRVGEERFAGDVWEVR